MDRVVWVRLEPEPEPYVDVVVREEPEPGCSGLVDVRAGESCEAPPRPCERGGASSTVDGGRWLSSRCIARRNSTASTP